MNIPFLFIQEYPREGGERERGGGGTCRKFKTRDAKFRTFCPRAEFSLFNAMTHVAGKHFPRARYVPLSEQQQDFPKCPLECVHLEILKVIIYHDLHFY